MHRPAGMMAPYRNRKAFVKTRLSMRDMKGEKQVERVDKLIPDRQDV